MEQALNIPPDTPLDDPVLYINRELSWLEFERRVLEEAQDASVPLLERLKFLAIFESNLDEFFMVRVGGLHEKVDLGIPYGSGADHTPVKVLLERIVQTITPMVAEAYRCLLDELLPLLEKEGIRIYDEASLSAEDRRYLTELFHREVFPVLTPLAIDPGHPFPHLLNKSLNLAVLLHRSDDPDDLMAVVQVPGVLPRFLSLPTRPGGPRHAFVPLETVIRLYLGELFPGMVMRHVCAFRITRDSDIEIDDDDEVQDLLKTIEEQVRQRRRGAEVRLQIESSAPEGVVEYLMRRLKLDLMDVYRVPRLLDLTGLLQIHGLPGYPQLRDKPFTPQPVPEFTVNPNPFAVIRTRDVLVHHPYETFGCVVDFIEAAARDERMLAIKQTLYRTSSGSPIVRALQRAADNGKQVTAVIEIKARLDEERNILWARELEKAGCHVVFGFIRLKTHCKVALVVRRDEDGSIRRYVHLATGNYNPDTARIYTDIGYFTCNPAFCEDASGLFNFLTGYGEQPRWRKLVVAPTHMQDFMIARIGAEEARGASGRIIAKVNGILEPAVVEALYRASRAGAKIDLLCRGICALRPGIPGISENIRVLSIVDRFLEHSRIFYFGNGGDPQVYIGSADWMDRNLSRRVEAVFPIEVPEIKRRAIEEILALGLADNSKARELMPDGSYRRVVPAADGPRVRSQERFLELAAERIAKFNEVDGVPVAPNDPRTVLSRRARSGKVG